MPTLLLQLQLLLALRIDRRTAGAVGSIAPVVCTLLMTAASGIRMRWSQLREDELNVQMLISTGRRNSVQPLVVATAVRASTCSSHGTRARSPRNK